MILILRAYLQLILTDIFLAHRNFNALYRKVRDHAVADKSPSASEIEEICHAVDMACIWYWKQVLCLQRSAATACLLKSHGAKAQMIIGAQQVPFRAHAWVELDGRVVSDKPYMRDMYVVLDRC